MTVVLYRIHVSAVVLTHAARAGRRRRRARKRQDSGCDAGRKRSVCCQFEHSLARHNKVRTQLQGAFHGTQAITTLYTHRHRACLNGAAST